jgi:N-acetylglutamate synthase
VFRVVDGTAAEPVSTALLQRCHENILEAFRGVARELPNGRLEEEAGVVRIASGLPGAEFNPVFVTKNPSDPAALVAASASFMAKAGVSVWRIEAFSGAEASVGAAALGAGLRPGIARPGMVLDPTPPRPPSLPAGLRIRRARNRSLWVTLVRVGMRGFGAEAPEDVERLFPFTEALPMRGYLGYVGKTPVATSMGLSFHGVGGIFFVATLPEFRGKGYGAALTWQAAVDARRDGCRVSYLQSSEMGYPVYARMGYRRVTTYSEWIADLTDSPAH